MEKSQNAVQHVLAPTQEVWLVSNKTSAVFFATEELAQQYVSAFAPTVSGGMSIQRASIIGAQPERKPAGAIRVSKGQLVGVDVPEGVILDGTYDLLPRFA